MFRLVALALLVAAASATTFDTCASGKAPLALRVSNCDSPPCKFIRGQNVVAEVDVAIDHAVSKLTPEVKVTSLGISLTYPLPEPNGCNSLTNSECPLSSGEEVTYHLEMPILQVYPLVVVDLQLSLLDQNNAVLECFKIQGQVVDA